jgi:hypothetical protein
VRLADVPSGLTPDRFIADVVARGQTILLVGIRPGNLPEMILGHRQVVFWPSNSRSVAKGAIPPNTGAVLFAKWISHTDHRRIRAMADKAGAYCPQALLGTGEMRVLLTALVPAPGDFIAREVDRLVHEAPETAQPVPEAAPAFSCERCPGTWHGSTRAFFEQHWDHEAEHHLGWQAQEARRLHLLAGRHGLTVTPRYAEGLVSQINVARGVVARDEGALSVEREALAARVVAEAEAAEQARQVPDLLARRRPVAVPVPAPTPVPVVEEAPPPAPTAATVKADEQRIGANLTELVRMLDDAAAVLQLARETVVDLAQQNARLQQSRDHLRARVNKLFDEGV